MSSIMEICPDCNGAGGDNQHAVCYRCNGSGGVPSSSTPEVVEALKAFLWWADQQCPCENEQPNPCTLCGASVENLEPCKAREAKFPPDILRKARAAIAALPPSNECARCKQIGEVLSKFITGGVHYAVEPELSTVDYSFALRDEAGELHRLLCEIHPLDDEGCFKNGSDARKARATLSKLRAAQSPSGDSQ